MKLSLTKFDTFESAVCSLQKENFRFFEDYSNKNDIYKLYRKGSQIVALMSSKNEYDYVKYLIRRVR